jgi:hypothetical protein
LFKHHRSELEKKYGLDDDQKNQLKIEDNVINNVLKKFGVKYQGTNFLKDANKI